MTSQQFSRLLHEPFTTDSQGLEEIKDIVARYPYCQSGQLLYTSFLFSITSPNYPQQLKKAAAYAGDRRILKNLIEHAREPQKETPADEIPVPPVPAPAPEPEPPLAYPRYEHTAFIFAPPVYEPLTQEELLAIVKKRLAEINAEKKREQTPADLHDPGSPAAVYEPQIPGDESIITAQEIPPSKSSLIEKFIQDEPRISKPRASFFNPTDSAIRSNFDDEEIVSETLARLYAQQGNLQKAKHIYEKLSLINQEKSRYFAAQIEKLSSEH